MLKLKCNTCDGIFDTVDIRFTKACNNKCSFCIEQFSDIKAKSTDVKSIVASVLKTHTNEVLILGGEPFLEMEKLLECVTILKQHNITVYITTSLPKVILEQREIFDAVLDKIDGLNVSVHHYKTTLNNAVYKNNGHNRLELLADIVKHHHNKVRVCLSLVKGVLDSEGLVYAALTYLNNIGVRSVKINELSHSNEYVSFEKIMGIKLGSPYATGCYTIVLDDVYPEMKIELKRSCFITEKTLSAGWCDFIKVFLNRYIVAPLHNKFCVVYEDGSVYNNWVTKIK